MRNNGKRRKKPFPVFNIVIISIIVLLVAGLFLLEKYKSSGYVYEGEYLYAEDNRHIVLNVEYNKRFDELLIDMIDIYRTNMSDESYYYDMIDTEMNLQLSMSDMDAALLDVDDGKTESFRYYDYFVKFDKKGLTLTTKTNPMMSYFSEREYYFYKNGWLNYVNAEIIQLSLIAGILVFIVICIAVNLKKRKKSETEVSADFYDKFTLSEIVYLHDSFAGMEDYFDNNVLDAVVELDRKYCKIIEKEIHNPQYRVSMVNEACFTKGKNQNTKQIEILDENKNPSEYVVLHKKDKYILKHRVEDMTVAIYKLKRILSVVLVLGLVGVTFGGCKQEVKDEYRVMGRIVSIEDDVLRLNMAVPTKYSSYEECDTKTIEYVFDKDKYFVSGRTYLDVYYEESPNNYVEYKLSDKCKSKIDFETILNETTDRIYEICIVNGKVQKLVKTKYYCLSHDNVPLGMYGELYYGMYFNVDGLADSDLEYEWIKNQACWNFFGKALVFEKLEDDKRTTLMIENINKLRMYRIDNPTGTEERYWVDTPGEDLIIEIQEGKYEVFSYPGGVFLDEYGYMGYYNSSATESEYILKDWGYEIIEQEITVINTGGED